MRRNGLQVGWYPHKLPYSEYRYISMYRIVTSTSAHLDLFVPIVFPITQERTIFKQI